MSSLCYLEREREGERGGKELSKKREVEKESGGRRGGISHLWHFVFL